MLLKFSIVQMQKIAKTALEISKTIDSFFMTCHVFALAKKKNKVLDKEQQFFCKYVPKY